MSTKSVVSWLRRTDWLWMVIGGFYLLAYLFWYIPALAALPNSLRNPPTTFPWHWPLDFAVTGFAGGLLVYLGFDRAPERGRRRGREARAAGTVRLENPDNAGESASPD